MRRGTRPSTAPKDDRDDAMSQWHFRRASSSTSSLHRGESSVLSSRSDSSCGGSQCAGYRSHGQSSPSWTNAVAAATDSEPFGSSSGWRWGSSGNWSPNATPMLDSARSVGFQPHVRTQSSNFDGPTVGSSLGQGLIGLRRSSVADRAYPAPACIEDVDGDNAILDDPARERAITRHGLHLQPPPEMDKIDGFLDLMAFTNSGWSFGLFVAVGAQGLVQVSGQKWNDASPLSQTAAFWRCCQMPWQNVVVESSVASDRNNVMLSTPAKDLPHPMLVSRSESSALAHHDSYLPAARARRDDLGASTPPSPQLYLTSAFRAICLSPAADLQPVPIGMLFAFQQRTRGLCSGPDFGKIVDSIAQTVSNGLERNANVMRREKELLAQSSLISMKRFILEECKGDTAGSPGVGIFSQAAMSIRAILKAHNCVIWDISCFRLFPSDGSGGSESSSDPAEGEAGANAAADTWNGWNIRTQIQEPDANAAKQSPDAGYKLLEMSASDRGDINCFVTGTVATTVAAPACPGSTARPSLANAQTGESEDLASSDGWTCSFPVTNQPISIIGSSGGSMDHFENLDGAFSRPLLAEFLATTKDLGLSSRPQAEGEHIKTAESSLFGEASSLASLLPPACRGEGGLVAVPIFEIDDQPAFIVLTAFEEAPVLEAADRHFVEQVGSILLTWSIRSRVARVDRAQTHFISKIQHELRTPLHAVIGTLDIIKEALGEPHDSREDDNAAMQEKELAALVDSAATSADALNNMINNVLDFGALKAMPVQPEKADDLPCFGWNDITSAISDTCKSEWMSALQRGELGAPSASEAGSVHDTPELLLDLDSEDLTGDLIASIDLEALQTVLRKLVNNAIRATSTGCVTIGLKVCSRDDFSERRIRPGSRPRSKDKTYDIAVTIEDTGKGMQKEFIESHLFAPYAKEDTFLPGSGLSLAIASRLVHRMGGHINVASSPDVGTCFSIQLPVRFGRKKSSPSGTRSIASQHRVAAYFAGFDPKGLAKAKAILARRHKLDEVGSPTDSRIIFITAELLSSASGEDILLQISRLQQTPGSLSSTANSGPSQLVVLERMDVKSDGPTWDQAAIDAMLRKHDLSDRVQGRKVPRPIGYKAFATIDAVKEHVVFPHQAAQACRSTVSEASASKSSQTRRSSEAPSLQTPMSLDAKPCPFGTTAEDSKQQTPVGVDGDDGREALPTMDEVDPHETPAPLCTDVRAAATEYGVEPATLREVQVAADSITPSQDFVVMVVEDNQLNARIITKMLDRAKINYVQAWNGREAVDLFREHLPQVVLLDITMPIMDGFQACAEIRKMRPANLVREDGSPCHRIIAVTALNSEADRLRGREAGMDDWLKKPLKMSRLINDLKAWKAQVTPV